MTTGSAIGYIVRVLVRCYYAWRKGFFVAGLLHLVLSSFFFSSRRRHTRSDRDWSSDVCSSDLVRQHVVAVAGARAEGDLASVRGLGRGQKIVQQMHGVVEEVLVPLADPDADLSDRKSVV